MLMITPAVGYPTEIGENSVKKMPEPHGFPLPFETYGAQTVIPISPPYERQAAGAEPLETPVYRSRTMHVQRQHVRQVNERICQVEYGGVVCLLNIGIGHKGKPEEIVCDVVP